MNGSVTYQGSPLLSGMIDVVSPEPTLETLNVTANGTYEPGEGVDGFNEVNVNVPTPEPTIYPLNIVQNGVYEAPEGVDGYSPIGVNVPIPDDETLNVYANGTYHPSSPDRRINEVIVDVPIPTPTLETLNVTTNGSYTPGSGVDGFNEVNVNVPQASFLAKRKQLTNEYGSSLGKVSTDSNFVAGKYYYFLIYNTTSTQQINQQSLVLCPSGGFSDNGTTIYIGSYEMLAYPDGIRMVSNPGAEKFITIFEVPDSSLTS